MGMGRDLFARRKDGSEFPVEIGLNPIETEEGPMVLSAIVDITDRKQREDSVARALREKDLLLGEIHHRVKNNLQVVESLLDLTAMRTADEGMLSVLRDSQNRVRSMALIHQTLYQSHDFRAVDFGMFLETMVPVLVSAYAVDPERVSVATRAHRVHLPITLAIPCGLVVNELVTNALKHGMAGRDRIAITVELDAVGEGEAELCVRNDGTAIPEGIDFDRSGTLGVQLVALLVRQMRGRLQVRRADPVRFDLRFPLGDMR